jgi:hypothetical protein
MRTSRSRHFAAEKLITGSTATPSHFPVEHSHEAGQRRVARNLATVKPV